MVLTRCSASRRFCSSFCGGMERRRNIDSAVSAGKFAAGGCPRPSFRWQLWQERELYSGPRPSELVVDDGAEIHSLRKMALPTLNLASPSRPMPCEKWENASRVSMLSRVVALPPGLSSPGSLGMGAGSPACTTTTARHTAASPGSRSSGRRRGPGFRWFGWWACALIGQRRATAEPDAQLCRTAQPAAACPCRLIT